MCTLKINIEIEVESDLRIHLSNIHPNIGIKETTLLIITEHL